MSAGDARVVSMDDERARRGQPVRCHATTREGRRCRNPAGEGGRCHVHTEERDGSASGVPHAAGGPAQEAVAGLEALIEAGWLDLLVEAVSFLRRRVTGDYPVGELGFDPDLTRHVLLPLLRPLYRHYWRVGSRGVGRLRPGGALLVANHAGVVPADALMLRLDVHEQTGRHVRQLGAEALLGLPAVGALGRRIGMTPAGDGTGRLLEAGELVTVWPEGLRGLGKPYRERYRLQRFRRTGHIAAAVRAGVPVVPTAIVGSEEIYPLLHNARTAARALGLPYLPLVAQALALPLLGPLALAPLPSKWIIEYGEPIDTARLGPAAAEDPMVVFDLTEQVRVAIQDMLDANVGERRSIFR